MSTSGKARRRYQMLLISRTEPFSDGSVTGGRTSGASTCGTCKRQHDIFHNNWRQNKRTSHTSMPETMRFAISMLTATIGHCSTSKERFAKPKVSTIRHSSILSRMISVESCLECCVMASTRMTLRSFPSMIRQAPGRLQRDLPAYGYDFSKLSHEVQQNICIHNHELERK